LGQCHRYVNRDDRTVVPGAVVVAVGGDGAGAVVVAGGSGFGACVVDGTDGPGPGPSGWALRAHPVSVDEIIAATSKVTDAVLAIRFMTSSSHSP
jgi:hypothetical protein